MDIVAKIGEMAEALVLASPSDMPVMGALHLDFKAVGEGWTGNGAPETAKLCAWSMALIEKIIMNDMENHDADMEKLTQAITLLQSLICEERNPEELTFPAGLDKVLRHAGGGSAGSEAEDSENPDPGLLADFVHEAMEHLEASDLQLMNLESDPGNAESINAVFRAFHTIKGVAGFLDLKAIQAFAHETEDLLEKVRRGDIALTSALCDVIFAAVDVLKKRVQWIAAGKGPYASEDVETMKAVKAKVMAASSGRPIPASSPSLPAAAPGMKLGDILVNTGVVARDDIGQALRNQEVTGTKAPLGELLVQQSAATPRDVALALRSQKQANEGTALVRETVKVEADRLDRLLDAIGELVIAESMIFQSPELKGKKSQTLSQQMVLLDKITRELQKMGTSLRMVPIRPIFQKMQRLARDLSRKSGKDVEFVSVGEETELDKTVVDKIGDPLIHMVRNSVDHGIEPDAAMRIEAGKPVQAKVTLRAFQKGGNVCIEISDDGRGLNREAILKKARERGLLKDDGASLPDREVWNFIFEAGFSTAAQITDVSGRGVGMDVVRRNIEELRGRIDIVSKAGEGTTFSIWLPLTLAIIDGMIVRVGGERFVFPTLSILRIVPLRQEEVRTVADKGAMLLLQDELIPILDLDGMIPGPKRGEGEAARLAVIVECNGRKAGLPVNELLGQQQVVIKGLGESLKQIPGLSGGAILSDGTVGIILDVDGLINSLRAQPAAA